jgi:hypothetical protein
LNPKEKFRFWRTPFSPFSGPSSTYESSDRRTFANAANDPSLAFAPTESQMAKSAYEYKSTNGT